MLIYILSNITDSINRRKTVFLNSIFIVVGNFRFIADDAKQNNDSEKKQKFF